LCSFKQKVTYITREGKEDAINYRTSTGQFTKLHDTSKFDNIL